MSQVVRICQYISETNNLFIGLADGKEVFFVAGDLGVEAILCRSPSASIEIVNGTAIAIYELSESLILVDLKN